MKRFILFVLLISLLTLSLASSGILAAKLKVPETSEKILGNGLKIIAIEHHEQPVVAMRLLIRAGTCFDPNEKAGLVNLTASLLRKGTSTRDANQISKEIDFVGGSLGAGSGLDATYVTCQVLTKHFDVGLDLFSDITLHPSFADEEIERLRKQLIAALVQSKDEPNTIVAEQYALALFGDHPYAKPQSGTLESVSGIARDDILSFWKEFYIPNNAVLFVAGDIDPQEVFSRIEAKFGGWAKGTLPEYNFPEPKAPTGLKIVLINKPDATQSNIKIGHLGINRYNPDLYACRVLNYIFGGGGFVSRLMKDVRAKRGLTYDINSRFSYNRFAGEFTVTTFTKNDSTSKAILATIDHLKTIRSKDVTDEELEETISFYSGYLPLQFETPQQIASQMQTVELYGLGESYLTDIVNNIAKVNAAAIRKAAQTYIDPDNLLIVVVGKGDDIREGLKKIAPVVELDLSDI